MKREGFGNLSPAHFRGINAIAGQGRFLLETGAAPTDFYLLFDTLHVKQNVNVYGLQRKAIVHCLILAHGDEHMRPDFV